MLRKVLRLARILCALMYRQNGDLANLLKSVRIGAALISVGLPLVEGGEVCGTRVRELAADVRDVVGSGREWRTRTIIRLAIRERLIKKKEEKLF